MQGDGTLLATGSYDGNARIWGRDGLLIVTISIFHCFSLEHA